jgi:hypothetical protein
MPRASVYVASSLKNHARVCVVQKYLRAVGLDIAHDWATPYGARLARGETETAREQEAELLHELDAAAHCDVLLFVLPAGRGAHVELGVAMGKHRPVVVLNERRDDAIGFVELAGPAYSGIEEAIAAVLAAAAKHCPNEVA